MEGNNESILSTVKKKVGLLEETTEFDSDIIMHTNTVLAILNQEGIGVVGFTIDSYQQKWTDFLGEDEDPLLLAMVPGFVGLKVKTLFDPPTGGMAEALNENLKELEFRIYIRNNYSGKPEVN